ncbi:MAG: chemotaxis protein CheW [Spirochaetia bacterium]|nr:chemotaxis protein CheW [Spirochaetia bacterium]
MAEDRYLELFLEEAGEQIEELSQALLRLEKEQTNAEIINDIFRNAHTLKSSAAFVQLDHLSMLAHHMEDLLHLIRSGQLAVDTALVNLLFRCLDRIKSTVRVVQDGGKPTDDFNDLVTALEATKAERTSNSPPSVPFQTGSTVMGAEPGSSQPSSAAGSSSTGYSMPQKVEEPSADATFELSIAEQEVLKSQAGTQHIYEGYVRLDAESPMKSLRFMLLAQNLKKAGVLFKSTPSEADLDAGKSESLFRFFFYGSISAQDLTKLCQIDMIEEVRISERQLGMARDIHKGSQEDTSVKTKNIKVSSEKIDYLLNSVGELVITNSGLQKIYEDLQEVYKDSPVLAELKSRIDQAARIARDLQSGIMKTRMIPVGLVFHRFSRPVRDLAMELGKEVEFEIHGEDTELDKNIIDSLNEPLLHLIRNSLDHGIEMPDERRNMGKSRTATISMHAYQSGNSVYLEVRDDGRGLNKEAILRKARANGLITGDTIPSDDEIYNLIFQAGFSTAEQVTDLSGRGVGMNVVKRMVQESKGNITIRNEPGQGAAFVLSFPLTLAIVAAILVKVEEEQYAFPLSDVIETIKIERKEITTLQGRDIIHLRGDILPVFPLSRLMGIHHESTAEECPVVIASVSGRKIAFLVDEMAGKKEIVIKTLEQNYQHVSGLIGACLMGDGRIVMVLDVQGLMDLAQKESARDSSLRALDAIAAMTEDTAVVASRTYNTKVDSLTKRIDRRAVRQSGAGGINGTGNGNAISSTEPARMETFAPQIEVRLGGNADSGVSGTRTGANRNNTFEMPADDGLLDDGLLDDDLNSDDLPSLTDESPVRDEAEVRAHEMFEQERKERLERAAINPSHAPVKISDADFAKLNSVVNTGMIQAGMVLSQLLGTSVEVSVPEFQAIDFSRLNDFLPPDPLVGVILSTEAGFKSVLLLVFDEETGYKAAADLMGLPATTDKRSISEEDLQSVISELANIVCASILNELANKTGISIPPTVPGYIHGSTASLVQKLRERDPGFMNRKLLYFSTDFYRGEMELLGRIFMVPDEVSLSQIVKKI